MSTPNDKRVKPRRITVFYDQNGNHSGIGGLIEFVRGEKNSEVEFIEVLPPDADLEKVILAESLIYCLDFDQRIERKKGFVDGAKFGISLRPELTCDFCHGTGKHLCPDVSKPILVNCSKKGCPFVEVSEAEKLAPGIEWCLHWLSLGGAVSKNVEEAIRSAAVRKGIKLRGDG